MPLKSAEENRNFTEQSIKLEKAQTGSKGDKVVYEYKRKLNSSNRHEKTPQNMVTPLQLSTRQYQNNHIIHIIQPVHFKTFATF